MTPVFRSTKLWLGLGAFALVHASGAAPNALAQQAGTAMPQPAAIGGGEGGEGGEGGVSAEQAATDPAAFLTALDVVAAHYLAGRGAYDAGQMQAAAELFAHPISEVYADMEAVFQARGVTAFRGDMERASDLALARAAKAEVDAAAGQVLTALAAAEARAPAPGATSAVQARVAADLVDRAASQHAVVLREPGELEPYLDGYGLFLAARVRAEKVLPALADAGRADVADRMRAALAALAQAFPGPVWPAAAPPVEPGALLADATRLKILTSALR